MNVNMLVTADREESLPQVLLFKDTLRVGFPNANITIYDNDSIWKNEVEKAAESVGAEYTLLPRRVELWQWIERMIDAAPNGTPMAIVDSDTIWWSSCEWFNFTLSWAGYYQPEAWSEWAECLGASRLHTSFLWVQRPAELRKALADADPARKLSFHEYRSAKLFAPVISYHNGQRVFYDTCAQAFHAINGEFFTEKHLDCYDHINSASFIHEMQNFEKIEGLKVIHALAETNPAALKGVHKEFQVYWDDMVKREWQTLRYR